MNKRQAKQEARRAVVRMLDAFLLHPLRKGDRNYEGLTYEWSETDWARFTDAVQELYNEMKRRSGPY